MREKPAFLGPEFARQYEDPGMAAAYPSRPPYPPAVFDRLQALVDPACRAVLDAGAGTGDVARPLAARGLRVDAVDPSAAMTAIGRALEGGDAAGLRWILGPAETAPLSPPYGLVTAGQSLAWMAWDVVLPRWRSVLSPAGRVALLERKDDDLPWWTAVKEVVRRHSTNRGVRGYDLVEEIVGRGLFEVEGRERFEGVAARRTVEQYLDGLHSMNGLPRSRMGAQAGTAFDAEVRAVLAPHARGGVLDVRAGATVVWGRPA